MTAVVAPPAAVLRVMRRAAGRRALQVVLVLGGLLALGFLWGGQAYAVESPTPARDAEPAVAGAVVAPVEEQSTRPVREGAEAVREAAESVTVVAEPVIGVAQRATRAVGEVAEQVDRRLPMSEPPAAELPVLPKAPGIPGASELPAASPVPDPSSDGAEQAAHLGTGERAQRGASGDVTLPVTHKAGVADRSYLSLYLAGGWGESVPDGHRDGYRSPEVPRYGQAPVQAPGGPCRDGVRPAAGDVSAPRSGDPAAAFADDTRFGLVRGAALPATAAPTCERPDEILEFPG
ncbi:hypothetical protein J7I98_14950 [Streptomyces sp. ISL-98]|uniref:hypothetical protein n=1 Tax=Streptomyces sp. ISL-98 TaxID=2819192 RepID=UPI001BE60F5D|nr:hypothetical protein [Streptomyces sp. ISL-98]MBT2507164.1 hypothetical protein [Streptomyces sp. ISL-98]